MFLLNSKCLITIILYSEIVWVVLYSYTTLTGIINDDVILLSTSILLLALAGLEFCIGFIITILYRSFKKSFLLDTLGQEPKKTLIKRLSINQYTQPL